jgi:hypothetical protein
MTATAFRDVDSHEVDVSSWSWGGPLMVQRKASDREVAAT